MVKDRNVLLLTEITSEKKNDEISIKKGIKKIEFPLQMEFNPIDKIGYVDNSVIYIDKDKIQYPLKLRRWRKGDTFQPFGMKGKKKLSKFFKDEKVSLLAKEKVWLLCSNSEIIWVIGHRADERFKVTSSTTNILKITVKN